jgi:uncharacterized protein (TIGR00290 family)
LKKKALFNWSSGKDSALALYKVLQNPEIEVCTLLTSVNEEFQRISMHGIRTELLIQQVQSIGLPLEIMLLPEMPSMEVYEEVMTTNLLNLKQQGISCSIFGDIFLEDLRKYREDKLAILNLEAYFPLWKIPTKKLIQEFISLDFKTIVVCVNERYLDKSFVGRIIDQSFLDDLPENVDQCGENGEFHTFTFDGPLFKNKVNFEIGEIVYRTYEKPKQGSTEHSTCTNNFEEPLEYGFWYCDLIPLNSTKV